MVGNDIVDLKLAKTQSNWQRKGFLEKQFTDYEQKEILNSENSFLKVWLFWAMKEATYKCYVQEYQKRFYTPSKFCCKIINNSSGIVKFKSEIYYIKYQITDSYIYTIAKKKASKKMVSDLFLMNKNDNNGQKNYTRLLAYFDPDVTLQKNEIGIPYLYQKEKKLPISISTTHHGKYGAYAFSYL